MLYSIISRSTFIISFVLCNCFFLWPDLWLVLESSISVLGTPQGYTGEFTIELLLGPPKRLPATAQPQQPQTDPPPIVLHYTVRMRGDKLTNNPVIVQNTWTSDTKWNDEERCPPPLLAPIKIGLKLQTLSH
jgi:beta-1,3-galactosyltransferase